MENYTKEAHRYLANAKETIRKSPIQYERYQDAKYVSEAAGIAYLGALKAINGYLINKLGYPKEKLPTSIEGYLQVIKKFPHNGKLTNALINAYKILHIGAYYRELEDVAAIKIGFQRVKDIINMLSK